MHKPSKGEELLKSIQNSISNKDISTNELLKKDAQNAPSDPEGVMRDGVEVVDVKIVPKEEDAYVDKFGIPHKGPRKTWDRI